MGLMLIILAMLESEQGRGEGAETETRGLEFVVGEIGEGVEGQAVTGIPHLVVSLDKGVVVLEHLEPVASLFFGGVCLAMLVAPPSEQFGGVGRSRGKRGKSEQENKGQQLQEGTRTRTTHGFAKK